MKYSSKTMVLFGVLAMLVSTVSQGVEVEFRNLWGREIRLNVKSGEKETVGSLKNRIAEALEGDQSIKELVYDGKLLEDEAEFPIPPERLFC